jgi:hypothetical protein
MDKSSVAVYSMRVQENVIQSTLKHAIRFKGGRKIINFGIWAETVE